MKHGITNKVFFVAKGGERVCWQMKVEKQVESKQGRLTRFETLGGYWRGYCLAEAGQRARENTGRADTANHTSAWPDLFSTGQ